MALVERNDVFYDSVANATYQVAEVTALNVYYILAGRHTSVTVERFIEAINEGIIVKMVTCWKCQRELSIEVIEPSGMCGECTELAELEGEDDDPVCVCGVYLSEHAQMGCHDGFATADSWEKEKEFIMTLNDDEFELCYGRGY